MFQQPNTDRLFPDTIGFQMLTAAYGALSFCGVHTSLHILQSFFNGIHTDPVILQGKK